MQSERLNNLRYLCKEKKDIYVKATKSKIDKWEDYVKLKPSVRQRKLSPNEKATYQMGENICKSFI